MKRFTSQALAPVPSTPVDPFARTSRIATTRGAEAARLVMPQGSGSEAQTADMKRLIELWRPLKDSLGTYEISAETIGLLRPFLPVVGQYLDALAGCLDEISSRMESRGFETNRWIRTTRQVLKQRVVQRIKRAHYREIIWEQRGFTSAWAPISDGIGKINFRLKILIDYLEHGEDIQVVDARATATSEYIAQMVRQSQDVIRMAIAITERDPGYGSSWKALNDTIPADPPNEEVTGMQVRVEQALSGTSVRGLRFDDESLIRFALIAYVQSHSESPLPEFHVSRAGHKGADPAALCRHPMNTDALWLVYDDEPAPPAADTPAPVPAEPIRPRPGSDPGASHLPRLKGAA